MESDESKPQEATNCDLGNKSDLEKDSYCASCEHKDQPIGPKKSLKTGTSLNDLEEKLKALESSYRMKDERLTHQPRVSADQSEVVDPATSKLDVLGINLGVFERRNSDEQTLSQYKLCESSNDQQQPGSLDYKYSINGSTSGTSSAPMQENTIFENFLKLPSPPSSLPSSSSSSHCSGSDNIDSLNESGSSSQQPNVAAKHAFKHGATVSAPEGLLWEKSEEKQLPTSASFPVSGRSARSHSNSSSYIYSSASVTSLPSMLQLFDDNVHIVWPLQETLSVEKGPEGEEEYKEGKQWLVLGDLGEGAYGRCELAKDQISDKWFCVKRCRYRRDEVLPMYLAAKANIPEIVEFFGATITGKTVCIFMEVLGPSIQHVVSKLPDGLDSSRALDYLQDVLKALAFIHKKGIVHNDVKGANVLFVNDLQLAVKLIDFGQATSSEDSPRSRDIWHTGCLLIEMLTGKRPHLFTMFQNASNINPKEYFLGVENGTLEFKVLEYCFDTSSTADYVLKRMKESLIK